MELTEIPKYRLEFIDMKVNEFINNFEIEFWPIDCVQLILRIQKENKLKLHIKSTLDLPIKIDARTFCIDSSYYTFINKNRIHYPFQKSSDRRLNFTIAHEFGHIYLNHFDLPDEVKPQALIVSENKEAHEFAGRLLMPAILLKNRTYRSTKELAKNFNVSERAISTRLEKLQRE